MCSFQRTLGRWCDSWSGSNEPMIRLEFGKSIWTTKSECGWIVQSGQDVCCNMHSFRNMTLAVDLSLNFYKPTTDTYWSGISRKHQPLRDLWLHPLARAMCRGIRPSTRTFARVWGMYMGRWGRRRECKFRAALTWLVISFAWYCCPWIAARFADTTFVSFHLKSRLWLQCWS